MRSEKLIAKTGDTQKLRTNWYDQKRTLIKVPKLGAGEPVELIKVDD